MARLEIEIVSTGDGVKKTEGLLEALKKRADSLKIDLFKADTKNELQQVGTALSAVTEKIKAYTNEALKSNQAFKDNQTLDVLIGLETKLSQIANNQKLLGDETKRANAEINAFQGAINKLISNGIDPADKEITDLQDKISGLVQKVKDLAAVPAPNIADKFKLTGNSIVDTENKVKNLQNALRMPNLSDRQIAQYNIRLQEARKSLEQLNNLGLRTGNALNNIGGGAMKSLGGSASIVSTEFGRIIQDAPYVANNFGAIGNNITRLTEGFGMLRESMVRNAAAMGKTVTTGQVFKAAFQSLLSPMSLVTIGISVAASAFTIFQMSAQGANKEIKENANRLQEAKKALDDYIASLSRAEKLNAAAAGGYGDEIAKLDILFNSIRKNTDARYGEGSAIEELNRIYPGVFKNLQENVALTAQNEEQYKKLRQSIIDTAKAQAALKLSGEATEKQVKATIALADIEGKLLDLRKQESLLRERQRNDQFAGQNLAAYTKQFQAIETQRQAYIDLASTISKELTEATKDVISYGNAADRSFADAGKNIEQNKGLIPALEKQLKALNEKKITLTSETDIAKVNADISKVQAELDRLNGKKVKAEVDLKVNTKGVTDYLGQLEKIGQKSDISVDKSGLTGQALDLTNVFNKYQELYAKTKEIEQKALADTQLTEVKKNEIIAESVNVRKQLRENEASEFLAISEKYAKKEVDIAADIQKQLQDLDKKYGKKESSAIEALKTQLQDYEKVLGQIKVATSDEGLQALLKTGTLKLQIEQLRNDENTQTPEKALSEFSTGLKRGVSQFTRNFFDSISNISQYAESSFSMAFSSIVNNMLSSFNSISFSFVSDLISKHLEKGINEGTDNLALKLGGAAVIAGGIISGATNKTSSLGQGLGGALSGAGAGVMIGTALGPGGALVGGIIGGLIGGIGGLLGASSARKKEQELLQKQLDEQKKQTDLLRQQAQAWTSSIIGQMSNMGLVTGTGRDAFGNVEFKTKIQGRDIVLVADRERTAQRRGV